MIATWGPTGTGVETNPGSVSGNQKGTDNVQKK